MNFSRHLVLRATLALYLLASAHAQEQGALQFTAHDSAGAPVADAQVLLRRGTELVGAAQTDASGKGKIEHLAPGAYKLQAEKPGFLPLEKPDVAVTAGAPIEIELAFAAVSASRDSVDVQAQSSPIAESASSASTVSAGVASQLPGRPATVADALPLIPGVVRSPIGGLQISGTGEHRSALIVNSADVTDPATGQFGPTIPIDSVQTLSVFQTPFLAEYGRFTSGLVSVETKRGGDTWKYDINDPLPDFRFRSYHLRGIRDATPRLNLSGPLIANKLFFSEGAEYEVRKVPVLTLPFPYNEQKSHGFNSFTQLDYIVSDSQYLTGTLHVAPQRRDFVGLNYFNPDPVTPNAKVDSYAGAIADHLSLKGGLLESTLAVTRFDAATVAQGSAEMGLTPTGNTGNYFATENRGSSRIEWLEVYSLKPLGDNGAHQIKFGSSIARTADDGQFHANTVNIFDAAGNLLQQTAYVGGLPFQRSDTEFAVFGQDHWLLRPNLAVDAGLRVESQRVTETFRFGPRVGVAYTPFGSLGTVFRAGFGLFYDHVPLNVYEFNRYPQQQITTYNADGSIATGPLLYENIIAQIRTSSPFITRAPAAGNFSPHSATWNAQVEQPVNAYLKLRAGFTYNRGSELITLNPTLTSASPTGAAMVLDGNGRSRYQQFDVTARIRLGEEERQLFVSYVRSLARGDLNDFSQYLGSVPNPIIRPDQFAYLPANLPNRFLAYGLVRLPWRFRIAPLVEYRNGFPYITTDASQQYAGIPNSQSFPNFFSLDARVSKDFQVNPKYAVRLSVSGYNLTNHFNPDTVFANTAAPAYGLFFGQHKRRYSADFDVIF